jgi:hypothetical protein
MILSNILKGTAMNKKLFLLYLLAFNTFSIAQSFPDSTILNELKTYTQIKDSCSDLSCNSINTFAVSQYDYPSAQIELSVSARKLNLMKLPLSPDEINIKSIQLDNKDWFLSQKNNNQFNVAIPEGNHLLTINFNIKNNLSVLSLSQNPQNFINKSSKIASFEQRNEGFFLVFDDLKKEIIKKDIVVENNLPFSPLFIVSKEIQFSNEWHIKTTVSPLPGITIIKPVDILIPLISKEKILTENIKYDDKNIAITMNNSPVSWESSLTSINHLTESVLDKQNYIEALSITSDSNWLYSFTGKNPNDINTNSLKWLLWPKETITFDFEIPKVIPGDNINYSNLNIHANLTNNLFTYRHELVINTSLGGRTYFDIPKDYSLTELSINNKKINIANPKLTKIALDLNVGLNNVVFDLNKQADWNVLTSFPQIKFDKPIYNINYSLENFDNRWLLLTGGANINPELIFISVTIFVILMSLLCSKIPSPLTLPSWIFILFGLAQTSTSIMLCLPLLLILLLFKNQLVEYSKNHYKTYNFYQLILMVLSLIVILSLLTTLKTGLLDNPSVWLYHQNYQFNWFNEHQVETNPWFISFDSSIYHFMMFAWAIFMAYKSINILKFIAKSIFQHEIWISKKDIELNDKALSALVVENKLTDD